MRCTADEDERVRYWAVRALDTLGDERLSECLAGRLVDASAAVRMAAARALAGRADRGVMRYVLETLSDPDPDVTYWATRAAAAYGEYAIPQLISLLGAADWRTREAAAESLRLTGEATVQPLIEALDRDQDDVRFWAIRTLGRLRAVRAAPRIRDFLDARKKDMAGAAMTALAEIGDRESLRQIVVFLGHQDPRLRGEAVEALARFGDFAVKLLADLLDGNRRVVKLAAAEALGKAGDSSLLPILEKLREDSAELRYWAVRALERLGSPVVLPLLLDLLADESTEVQLAASEALAAFELDPEVAPRLRPLLGAEDWRVRQAVARSLGRQASWPAEAYRAWLEDEDEDIRFWTVKILGERDQPDSIPLLLEMFDDPAWPIRRGAAEGLARFGAAAVAPVREAMVRRGDDANQRYWLTRALVGISSLELVPGLVALLGDPDAGVRGNAREALVAMGDAAVPTLLAQLRVVETRVLREGIAKVLVEMKTQRLKDLLDMLGFSTPELDHWVTWVLGHLGDTAAPALAERVRSGGERERYLAMKALHYIESPLTVQVALEVLEDEFPSLRRQAARTLGRLRVETARPALLELLQSDDPDMQLAALEALGRIGGEGAREAIEPFVTSPRWEVQRVALTALSELGDPAAAPAVRELLGHDHKDLWPFAATTLGKLGTRDDVPALASCLSSADPRDLPAMARALGALGGTVAAGALVGLFEHPDWAVQEAALEAYAELGEGTDPEPLKARAGSGDPLLRAAAREGLKRVLGPKAWGKMLGGRMRRSLEDPAHEAYQKAVACMKEKDREGARKALRKALRISKRAEYYGMLGALCMETGDRVQAERHLTRAVSLAPEDPVPLVKLGVLQAMLGKERKAAATLRRVLATEGLAAPVRDLAHRTLARLPS